MKKIKQFDVESMSEKEIAKHQKKMSAKILKSIEKAKKEIDAMANQYGLEIFFSCRLIKQGEANLIKETLKSRDAQS